MSYAEGTSVPVDRSKAEIERTLARYGAEKFAYFVSGESAAIAFTMNGRAIRIRLPIPSPDDFTRTEKNRIRTVAARKLECERSVRSRWRALLLVTKAKLEAIAAGIATFETEFLPYTVLPGGKTVAEEVEPRLERAQKSGELPQLLLGLGGS